MSQDDIKKQSNIEQVIADLKYNNSTYKDCTKAIASVNKMYFDELKSIGFTDEQALYLVGIQGFKIDSK